MPLAISMLVSSKAYFPGIVLLLWEPEKDAVSLRGGPIDAACTIKPPQKHLFGFDCKVQQILTSYIALKLNYKSLVLYHHYGL